MGIYAGNSGGTGTDPSRYFGPYLKDPKNISFSVVAGGGPGMIKSLRLKFSDGVIGDFSWHKTGLRIKNADIEARDLQTGRDGSNILDLQTATVGAIYLHSAAISEADLEIFAASWFEKTENIRIKIGNGEI